MVHLLHQGSVNQLCLFQGGGGQLGDKAKKLDFVLGEGVALPGLHVNGPNDLIPADQGHGHQRGELAFAGAKNTVKARIGRSIGQGDGLTMLGRPAG